MLKKNNNIVFYETPDNWDRSNYQYSDADYRADSFESSSFSQVCDAYLNVCSLQQYTSDSLSNIGNVSNIDPGTGEKVVNNVSLDGMDSAKMCLGSMGASVGSLALRLQNVVNAMYNLEVDRARAAGQDINNGVEDYAAFLKEFAKQNVDSVYEKGGAQAFADYYAEVYDTVSEDYAKDLEDENNDGEKFDGGADFAAWGVDSIFDLAAGFIPSALEYAGYSGAALIWGGINDIASKYIFEAANSGARGTDFDWDNANANAGSSAIRTGFAAWYNKSGLHSSYNNVISPAKLKLSQGYKYLSTASQAGKTLFADMGVQTGLLAIMYTGANIYDNMHNKGMNLEDAVKESHWGENILLTATQTVFGTAGETIGAVVGAPSIGRMLGSTVGATVGSAAKNLFVGKNGEVSQGACAIAGGASLAGAAIAGGLVAAAVIGAAPIVAGLAVAGAVIGGAALAVGAVSGIFHLFDKSG